MVLVNWPHSCDLAEHNPNNSWGIGHHTGCSSKVGGSCELNGEEKHCWKIWVRKESLKCLNSSYLREQYQSIFWFVMKWRQNFEVKKYSKSTVQPPACSPAFHLQSFSKQSNLKTQRIACSLIHIFLHSGRLLSQSFSGLYKYSLKFLFLICSGLALLCVPLAYTFF